MKVVGGSVRIPQRARSTPGMTDEMDRPHWSPRPNLDRSVTQHGEGRDLSVLIAELPRRAWLHIIYAMRTYLSAALVLAGLLHVLPASAAIPEPVRIETGLVTGVAGIVFRGARLQGPSVCGASRRRLRWRPPQPAKNPGTAFAPPTSSPPTACSAPRAAARFRRTAATDRRRR